MCKICFILVFVGGEGFEWVLGMVGEVVLVVIGGNRVGNRGNNLLDREILFVGIEEFGIDGDLVVLFVGVIGIFFWCSVVFSCCNMGIVEYRLNIVLEKIVFKNFYCNSIKGKLFVINNYEDGLKKSVLYIIVFKGLFNVILICCKIWWGIFVLIKNWVVLLVKWL